MPSEEEIYRYAQYITETQGDVARTLFFTGTCSMDLNFPVFASGVCIIRASNDVGTLFLGPGSTRILEINTRLATKWRGTAKFLIIVDFPDF